VGNHIFICYAREDKEFVLKLADRLKSLGVPVWLDTKIKPSEDWQLAIDKAIDNCAHFLIVLSPDAVSSRDVRGELRRALNKDKSVTPALYRECDIPTPLLPVQYADFTSGNPAEVSAIQHLIEFLGGQAENSEPQPVEFRHSRAGGNPGENHDVADPVSEQPSVKAAEVKTNSEESPAIIVPSPFPIPLPLSEITNSIGMEFILIPAGEFFMGSENGGDDEKPVRKVIISESFYLGKYPVTQAQWEAVMGNNPSHFKGDASRPVERVSWDDAQAFLQKLSTREGGKSYRLSTEAEWEYACRAGSTGDYCFGDDATKLKEYAWYDKNSGGTTHPVGQLQPNAWGLYDIHGNVSEWVQDRYSEGYYKQRSNLDRDPQGPNTGSLRVLRGGACFYDLRLVRCAFRLGDLPYLASGSSGMRVVVLPS